MRLLLIVKGDKSGFVHRGHGSNCFGYGSARSNFGDSCFSTDNRSETIVIRCGGIGWCRAGVSTTTQTGRRVLTRSERLIAWLGRLRLGFGFGFRFGSGRSRLVAHRAAHFGYAGPEERHQTGGQYTIKCDCHKCEIPVMKAAVCLFSRVAALKTKS